MKKNIFWVLGFFLLTFGGKCFSQEAQVLIVDGVLASRLISLITWKDGEIVKNGDVVKYTLTTLSSKPEMECESRAGKSGCTIYHPPRVRVTDAGKFAEIEVSHYYGDDIDNLWHRLSRTTPGSYTSFQFNFRNDSGERTIKGSQFGHFYATISFKLTP